MTKKIWIDAGHGGKDPGAVAHGLQEKNLTLKIAKACRKALDDYRDVDIKMTRTTDRYVDLNSICSDINSWGADIAVSIHINAGGGTGREALVSRGSAKAEKLADCILDEIGKTVPVNRGIKTRLNSDGKTDYFAFNRIPNCPSPIIECFFIDSDDHLYSKKCTAIGKAIAAGIVKYLGLVRKPQYKTYEIRANRLNIRTKPGLTGRITGKLKKGDRIAIVSVDSNGWGRTIGNTYIRIKGRKKTYAEEIKK